MSVFDEFLKRLSKAEAEKLMANRSQGTWDPAYRSLEKGEVILATDQIQCDDGSWTSPGRSVGGLAPDPNYTSHRVYRRLIA